MEELEKREKHQAKAYRGASELMHIWNNGVLQNVHKIYAFYISMFHNKLF